MLLARHCNRGNFTSFISCWKHTYTLWICKPIQHCSDNICYQTASSGGKENSEVPLFNQDVLGILTGKQTEIRTLPTFLKGISCVHHARWRKTSRRVQYFAGDDIKMIDSTENDASCSDRVNGNNFLQVWSWIGYYNLLQFSWRNHGLHVEKVLVHFPQAMRSFQFHSRGEERRASDKLATRHDGWDNVWTAVCKSLMFLEQISLLRNN